MKRLKNIRSLKGHYKDVEYENCAGDTDCCRIIRKCDEELGEVAGKLDTERILRTVLVSSRERSRDLRVLFHGS